MVLYRASVLYQPSCQKLLKGNRLITIRKGSVADAPRVSELLVSLSEEFILADFSEDGRSYFLSELAPEKMAERLSGDFQFLLAEDSGVLVGVATTYANTHLYYLFVSRSHQRRGLAKRLWTQVKENNRVAGTSTVFTVNASNYAIQAYERLGFVLSGEAQQVKGVIFNPMRCQVLG